MEIKLLTFYFFIFTKQP